MSFVIRYLAPLIRSRRRSSFSFFIFILIFLIFILFTIDHNRQILDEIGHSTVVLRKIIPVNTVTTQNASTIENNGLWPVDENGRSLKTQFLALDLTGFFGSGATEGARIRCPSSNTSFLWTRQQNRVEEVDFIISHDAGGGQGILEKLHLDKEKQQYSMAFIMESEVHSSTGDSWAKYNFKMSYNLDDSYPEPATYFDVNIHIPDLLRPPTVSFDEKEKSADVVWIISNCNAHNGREGFVQRLMQEIKVDSYGMCLNNRQGYGARMTDNVSAYKKYKFVIAIENSNCADYVSEKLVKAVESGSIPIIAGTNGRPDYRRYMPKHSYLNVFDYKSVKDLADDIKRIASNKTLYESYLWYRKHNKNVNEILTLPLSEKLKHLADVIGTNATMITAGIAGKEKSEDKVCKLIRFVRQTPWQDIAAHKKTQRAGSDIACLPSRSILTHFDSFPPTANKTDDQ